MSVSPVIRQLFVIGACQLGALSSGGAVGYPMVLLQQLRGDESTIKLNLHTASWIGSIHGLAGIFSIIVTPFMQWKGRKIAFITGCLVIIVGWIVAYNATSVTAVLISESFHGFGTNSLFTVCILSMSEMTSPKYRNVSVQSYGIIQALGMSVSGILSRCLDWKAVSMVMCAPITVALLMSFLWPESPSWLACKGRFDKSEEAFKQLRLMGRSSKKELEELITAQKENLSSYKNKNERSLKLIWSKTNRRDFYLPTIHIFLLLNLMYWSGTGVVLIYSLEVIQKTTQNDNAAFLGGIIMNAILFVGLCISSILSKRFNNKTLLLLSIICVIACLFGLFVVTLLQSTDSISKESLICLYFLIAYITVSSLGVIPLVFSIISEIMPVKHRGVGGAMYIIFNCTLYASSLKVSPYLFSYINLWGTFLLFTLNAIVSGLVIWRFVPETKNKTLQQIEDFYMYGKFIDRRLKTESQHITAGL